MMSDIPLAYDFYLDSMIEDMQNDSRPKHPEDIDREVQQLKEILKDLVDVLVNSDTHTNWSYDDFRRLLRIENELKGDE
jgi:hypothetical protein